MFYNRYYYRPSITATLIAAPFIAMWWLAFGIIWLCFALCVWTFQLVRYLVSDETQRTATAAYPPPSFPSPPRFWTRTYGNGTTAVASATAVSESGWYGPT